MLCTYLETSKSTLRTTPGIIKMNSFQILECFNRIAVCRPYAQYTVVPSDKLLDIKIERYPFFVCINKDSHTKSGSHWIGMYIARSGGELEFFDSYGLSIDVYPKYLVDFASKNNLSIVETRRTLQGPASAVCGHYVIMYMYFRLKGCSRKYFYAKFSNNRARNDKIVFAFVNKLFIKNFSKCIQFQTCNKF